MLREELLKQDEDKFLHTISTMATNNNPNSNKYKYKNVYLNDNKLWTDQYPPANIEQIYEHSLIKISQIKSKLAELERTYKLDERNQFMTMNTYAQHLLRLRSVVGIDEINSSKVITDLIRIVRNNIKYSTNDVTHHQLDEGESAAAANVESTVDEHMEQLNLLDQIAALNQLRKESLTKLSSVSPVDMDDEFSASMDERPAKDKTAQAKPVEKSSETLEEKLKKLVTTKDFLYNRRRKQQPAPVHPNDVKLPPSDPVITPLLKQTRKKFIRLTDETETDTDMLETLLGTTLSAMDAYLMELENVECLCTIFEKYFLSFFNLIEDYVNPDMDASDPSVGAYKRNMLDNVIKYEEKRKEHDEFVRRTLRRLDRVNRNFRDPNGTGVTLKQLSEDTQKLAGRYDADKIQLLLIMPEFSGQLNKCLYYLEKWLDYDRNYIGYITVDLKTIETEKKRLLSVKNSTEATYNQLVHRIHLLKTNLDEQERNLRDLVTKAEAYFSYCASLNNVNDDDEDDDEDENDQVDDTTSTKKKASYTRRKNAKHQKNQQRDYKYDQLDCGAMLEQAGRDLNELEAEMMRLNRVVLNGRSKKGLIEEKLNSLEAIKLALERIHANMGERFDQKCVKQRELATMEKCYFKLKEIFMSKYCSDTIDKIYYNMELPSFKLGIPQVSNYRRKSQDFVVGNESGDENILSTLNSMKKDKLIDAFYAISNSIGPDWVKLYYILPFYPPRGEENIKKDIDDVFNKLNRGNMQKEQSYYSLLKWKRYNSRAKIEDLKNCLKSIGRDELIKEVEKIMLRDYYWRQRQEAKKSSVHEDLRKKEIELLHQRLVRFMDKIKNGNKSDKFDFKFITKHVEQ